MSEKVVPPPKEATRNVSHGCTHCRCHFFVNGLDPTRRSYHHHGYFLNEIHLVTHWPECDGKDNSSKLYLELAREKIPNFECMFVHLNQRFFCRKVEANRMAGKKQKMDFMWQKLRKMWKMTNPHHCLTTYLWNVLNVNTRRTRPSLNITRRCWSNGKSKKIGKSHAQTVAWSFDMAGHAPKCVERFFELANKTVPSFA